MYTDFQGSLTHQGRTKMEGYGLQKLPSQKTKVPCRGLALPWAPCLPLLEKGRPHPLPWAKLCSTTRHPVPLRDPQTPLGNDCWGLNWLDASSPAGTQIRNNLDSGEDGRKVLEKGDLAALVSGARRQGASWASPVIAIATSWSQDP